MRPDEAAFPAEEDLVANAVKGRCREFTTARRCARADCCNAYCSGNREAKYQAGESLLSAIFVSLNFAAPRRFGRLIALKKNTICCCHGVICRIASYVFPKG
jgi:hypothetical protein